MHNERDIPDVTPTDGWRIVPRDGKRERERERGERGRRGERRGGEEGEKKQDKTPSCGTVG
jgi:hypothetical protein